MNSYRCRIVSLLKKPVFTRTWLLPVWIILGISRLVILTLSFRRLAPFLGHSVGLQAYTHLLTSPQERRAVQISHVIHLASRYCPWVANCFPQAVTARLMLGLFRIPYALYFGLARDRKIGEFKAHAWVMAGRVPVSGGHGFTDYTVVGCYLKKIDSEPA
ncbi:lasso peptide biosynthesis B2 protein [Halomonas daqiaonensis]|uniref:Transglutaminase-like superfamily protein n=1 Tax=Halomonas daqiaonensis TaxID=650850 RepID=A0A1H7HHZ7_9GAMM|nr:lasso peptide biosynthesis B2 protein [Halomonas daqiaonensis]SEK49277.1 Transglutaminase-like superfamily protein [Halomonas daqiaonensis]